MLVADGQGTPAVTQKLVDEIRRLTPQPIVDVVVCSEHGDHTGGNVCSHHRRCSCRVPRRRRAADASRQRSDRRSEDDRADGDRLVEGALRLGTTEIDVVYNGRAHTGGDLEVYLPAEKILFASEVFTNHIFPSMRTARANGLRPRESRGD